MVVKIFKADVVQVIELTEERIKTDKVANKIVGKKSGDSFKHINNLTGLEETFTVEQVFDKYQGLAVLILEEVRQRPINGMGFQSYQIDVERPDQLLEQLKQLVGPRGTQQKILIDSARADFANHRTGFLELTVQAFGANPIAAWAYITSDISDGFPIMPLVLLPSAQKKQMLKPSMEYVLDFSSLLTLYSMFQKNNIELKGKPFVVSQFTIDFVRNELQKVRFERESYMSVSVQVDSVTPHFYAENHKSQKIEELLNLLNWIRVNCRPDFATERLSWEWHDDPRNEVFENSTPFISSVMDTVLLAGRANRVFITDDLVHHKANYVEGVQLVTTEYFLRQIYEQEYEEKLWLDLVRLNYRGLTLSGEHLFEAFSNNKMLITNTTDFARAKHSTLIRYNPSTLYLAWIPIFLKYLYADNIQFEYKRQVTRTLLQEYLVGLNEQHIQTLIRNVGRSFKFLPDSKDAVIEDIIETLELINTEL